MTVRHTDTQKNAQTHRKTHRTTHRTTHTHTASECWFRDCDRPDRLACILLLRCFVASLLRCFVACRFLCCLLFAVCGLPVSLLTCCLLPRSRRTALTKSRHWSRCRDREKHREGGGEGEGQRQRSSEREVERERDRHTDRVGQRHSRRYAGKARHGHSSLACFVPELILIALNK